MTEVLTSQMIKDLVWKLEADSAKRTKPCPDCGGEPWGEDEWSRLCTVCRNYQIRVDQTSAADAAGVALHEAMMKVLADD